MTRFATAFLLPFVLFSAEISAQEVFQREIFVLKSDTLRYRIAYPPGFDATRPYPVLLFLHGSGERGRDNERQLVHGGRLFASDSFRTAFPAVVIVPQCSPGGYWARVDRTDNGDGSLSFTFHPKKPPTMDMKLLLALLTRLRREPWFDRSRFYTGGLSMGGMGTFDLMIRRPRWSAGAFIFCGATDPSATGRIARRTPVWMFHGSADRVVNTAYARATESALRKAGGSVRFTTYPGLGHNAWDPGFQEPGLFPWLFEQKRKK